VKKTRRILLINPVNPHRKGFTLRNESRQAPLGLGMVAAATPAHWSIKIWDENFRPFQYRDADLVGITAFTSTCNRAYEIAAMYRRQGIPVVMGGIHASTLPDEALQFVDSVVVGEAEKVWPMLLNDFENNSLKPLYRGGFCQLSEIPRPRHDLFHPGYYFASIQTSRGCPMNCDFCSVPAFNGFQYRFRDTEAILDEIAGVRQNLLYFVDDNITGYNEASRQHAMQLFEGMIGRGFKKEWFAQASLNIVQHPDILKAAAQSGCRLLLIGIESESEEGLKSSNKMINLKMGVSKYREAFRTIHKHGIGILGAFIFGLDSDTPADIAKRNRYILRSPVDVVQASVLTPLPGTRLFDKINAEKRLLRTNFPDDWKRYHFVEVVHRPAKMGTQDFALEVQKAYQITFSKINIFIRFLRTWWNTRSLRTAIWAWNSNMNYRSLVKEHAVEYPEEPISPNA
jgi:radical SAM superfamily enzyme YgiQ (UPF0313 family)